MKNGGAVAQDLPLDLQRLRGVDQDHTVDPVGKRALLGGAAGGTRLEEQGDVDDHQGGVRTPRLLGAAHEFTHHGPAGQAAEEGTGFRVREDEGSERLPVERAVFLQHPGTEGGGDLGQQGLPWSLELVDDGVRIHQPRTASGKHARNRALSRGDATRQSDHAAHPDQDTARVK